MNFPSFGLPAYTLPFLEEGRSFPPGLGNFLSLQASRLPRGVQAAPWSAASFGCCLSCAECRGLLEWASQQWRGSCLASAVTDSGMVCSVPQARFYQQDA